jgi:hypothetical protein
MEMGAAAEERPGGLVDTVEKMKPTERRPQKRRDVTPSVSHDYSPL